MPPVHYPPHPILNDSVKCLWRVERHFELPNDTFELLPDSYIELIFNFGVPVQLVIGDIVQPLPPAYMVGLLNKPIQLRALGTVKIIAVRLWAWGVFSLFGLTVGHLPQAVQELDTTFQHLYERLTPYMHQGDEDGAITYLHTFFVQSALQRQFAAHEIQAAARVLHQQHGTIKIEDIATYCHLSRRHLERKFQQAVGVSPKHLAKKIRFEQVRDRLWREPDANLGDVAYAYGYADQSHFIREFKAFSNRTPHQFATEMAATRSILHTAHGAFIQDT